MTKKPSATTTNEASILSALPSHVRASFKIVRASNDREALYFKAEHTNTHAAPNHRADDVYDAERALKRAGFETWRERAHVEIHFAE
jgi:hypothetical protein